MVIKLISISNIPATVNVSLRHCQDGCLIREVGHFLTTQDYLLHIKCLTVLNLITMISTVKSPFLGHNVCRAKAISCMTAALIRRQRAGQWRLVEVSTYMAPSFSKTFPASRYSTEAITAEKTEEESIAPTPSSRRFLPMTRRTLSRQLLEDEKLYQKEEHLTFQDLAIGLDSAISRGFHGTLGEMKSLYDPLNPDKETMVFGNMGKSERLDNEFWLLQKLSGLLEKAHFYELPRPLIDKALAEHPALEGVMVSVDTSKYDVLRFWVLGEDTVNIESNSAVERLKYYSKRILGRQPDAISRYKRVVVAVRTKKQTKLMLKAFKDIPRNSLEYLLPEGSIRMKRNDKGLIATTVFIGLASGALKLASSLSQHQVPFTYIAALMTFVLALRAWNAYKNKRNSYLLSLSKLLYFKTLANNRALLALIVDRAEDETFKSALITYTFLRSLTRPSEENLAPEVTAGRLKGAIEHWLKTKYNLDVAFSTGEPIKQLEDLGLLNRVVAGGIEFLDVVSLDEAIRKVPVPPMDIVSERKEDLEIEELAIESDDPFYSDGGEPQIDSSNDGKDFWK